MTIDVLFYMKLVLYAWAIVEVGILTTLYFYAYTEMKNSRVIKYLAIFSASVLFELIYRFILNYSVKLNIDTHGLLRDALIIPLSVLIISVRGFRKASTSKVLSNLKEE